MGSRFATVVLVMAATIGCGNSTDGAGSGGEPSLGGTTASGGTSGGGTTGGRPAGGGPAGGGASGTGGGGSGGTMCREVVTDPRPTFDACGGDPTGTWRLTSMDATGMFLTINYSTGPDTVETAECDTDLASQTERFDYLMNFAEGGAHENYLGTFQISLLASNTCFVDAVGVNCDDIALGGGQCRSDTCGVCKCDLGIAMPASGAGAWSVTDGTLLVNGSPSYDFCVTGDSMALLQRSGIRFTFERVHGTGQPAPCAERTSETCARGTGCAWSGSTCSGTAPAACDLADYVDTPGCSLAVGP